MLRIVVKEVDGAPAAHVGGPNVETVKTFDIEAPDLEAHLRKQDGNGNTFLWRNVVGVEIL